MYITLESDYAVRITAELCKQENKLDAKTLSERCCVSLRFALKILRKLVAADIVKSSKGTQGGYIINMKPKDITLKMVLEATEGTYYFSRCLAEGGDCNRNAKGRCPFQKAFGDITKTVRQKLEEYTFDKLLEEQSQIEEKENAEEQQRIKEQPEKAKVQA